jgi:hypothetical protein
VQPLGYEPAATRTFETEGCPHATRVGDTSTVNCHSDDMAV